MRNLGWLVAVIVSTALLWNMRGYAEAVSYIESYQPEVVTEYVPIREVSIPGVYNAKELNEYCHYEWSVMQSKGWLPSQQKGV